MSILTNARGAAARAMLCGALAGISLDALAGPYVGSAGVYAGYRSDDVDDATGHKFFAGYRFGDTPLLVEAAYLDLGDADVDAVADADFNFSGYQLSLGYFDRFDASSDSGFWAKLGYYAGDSELRSGAHLIDSKTSHGASMGFGADWMFLPFMGLRLELDDLLQIQDFGDDSNAVAISLGLVFELPVGRRARRAPTVLTAPADAVAAIAAQQAASEQPVRFFEMDAERAAPTPQADMSAAAAPASQPTPAPEAQPTLPAAPAPQAVEPATLETIPAEAPAPAPVEAAAPENVEPENPAPPLDSVPLPPQTPLLRVATPLRRQPMRNAVADVVVPRGDEVAVRGRVTNSDGQWRFVEYRGLAGWVPVDSLVEP